MMIEKNPLILKKTYSCLRVNYSLQYTSSHSTSASLAMMAAGARTIDRQWPLNWLRYLGLAKSCVS